MEGVKGKDDPEYIIWYIQGKNHKKFKTLMKFKECNNVQELNHYLYKLENSKLYSDIKYTKITY